MLPTKRFQFVSSISDSKWSKLLFQSQRRVDQNEGVVVETVETNIPTRPASTRTRVARIMTSEDSIVSIHVYDDYRKEQKTFRCPRGQLLENMDFFKTLFEQNESVSDIDVHCDIIVFEWLMDYVRHRHRNKPIKWPTDLKSVVSILISAHFLVMGALVNQCLFYCSERIHDLAQVPIDFGAIDESLISRLADLLKPEDVETVLKSKKPISRLLAIRKLLSYGSTRPVYQCKTCRRVSHAPVPILSAETVWRCCPAMTQQSILDRRGRLHVSLSNWTRVEDQQLSWQATCQAWGMLAEGKYSWSVWWKCMNEIWTETACPSCQKEQVKHISRHKDIRCQQCLMNRKNVFAPFAQNPEHHEMLVAQRRPVCNRSTSRSTTALSSPIRNGFWTKMISRFNARNDMRQKEKEMIDSLQAVQIQQCRA